MNHTFRTLKWKRHSTAIARKRLRRQRRKKGQTLFNSPKYFKKISAPAYFSMIKNPEGMVRFYHDFENVVSTGAGVDFDLSQIKVMTVDAVLYTLYFFDYLKSKRVYYFVRGNEPKDQECKRIFQESGFYKYVQSSQLNKTSYNIFPIESGTSVDPTLAEKIIDFTRDRLLYPKSKKIEGVFITLVECMTNTIQWAYEKNYSLNKWWVAAYYDKNQNKIFYIFLDNGQGIPSTVSKRFPERVAAIFKKITKQQLDTTLIKSALKGEFRTRTKQSSRGKGLPQIYSFAKEGKISDLRIMSNRGYIDTVDPNNCEELSRKFIGTLFSWSYSTK
ncbi:MAG: hypothetical protein WCW17_00280 [Patescibacteria group bacterium]|jgi:hypothetical protein